ncbi:lysozyme inhibitor LprI family protein [Pseudomonas sp. MDT1-17]
MKRFFLGILCTLTCQAVLPVSTALAQDQCNEITKSQQIDKCSAASKATADSRLNTSYHQLLARLETRYQDNPELGTAYVVKVKESQRAWIKLRDANCHLEAFEIEPGKPAYVTTVNSCITGMSRERSVYLDKVAPDISAGSAAQTADVVCPSSDFNTFLASFSESAAIQKVFVQRPLSFLVTVDAEPEPQQEKRSLSDDQIKFPLVPERAKREAEGLMLTVKEQRGDKATAILQKPDTDYVVEYRFERGQCWMLSEVSDFAL